MASKDIAESPTASPERPKERLQVNKTIRLQVFLVRSDELGVILITLKTQKLGDLVT